MGLDRLPQPLHVSARADHRGARLPKGLGIALSQAGPGSRDQNDLAGDVKQVLSIHHAHIVQSSNLSFTESLWA